MVKLYRKLERKFSTFIFNNVPNHSEYRPTGIHSSAFEYAAGCDEAELRVVYKPNTLHWNLDEDFVRHIRRKPPPSMQKPAFYVLRAPGGRVLADPAFLNIGITDNKSRLIGGVSFQYNKQTINDVSTNAILKARFFREPTRISGSVFSMINGAGGANNYFHWMYDALPRINLLEESGFKVDFYLAPGLSRRFQKETLQTLGIDESQTVDFSAVRHIIADQLIVSNSAGDTLERTSSQGIFYPRWVVEFLRKKFWPVKTGKFSMGQAIYISRRDVNSRKIINETELIEAFEKHNIKIYTLEDMPFTDQVGLFYSASLVVAPHGAGLANLAFCRPGTQVLEIFPSHFVKALYAYISFIAGLKYNYYIGEGVGNSKKSIYRDFRVDATALTAIMANIWQDMTNSWL